MIIVQALASYRVVRLLQRDSFPPALALRTWVDRKGPWWLRELWECSWCLGWWTSLIVAIASRRDDESVGDVVVRAAASSMIVGVLGELEERLRP